MVFLCSILVESTLGAEESCPAFCELHHYFGPNDGNCGETHLQAGVVSGVDQAKREARVLRERGISRRAVPA